MDKVVELERPGKTFGASCASRIGLRWQFDELIAKISIASSLIWEEIESKSAPKG